MAVQTLDLLMHALAYPVAGGIFINQLDELFIDANYYLRGLHKKTSRRVSRAELRDVHQKRIAILLPAWQESEVIERMLLHNLRTLDYDPDRYVIFCGTYRNDLETQARVDAVARRFRSVRKVVVPNDGPTSKADCLNWIYKGMVLEEERRGHRFDILLMQDAEDLVHPLALRLYSLLIPEHDFVQTPVFSLDIPLKRLVAGTYIDEFAEHHLKDMPVREAIGGLIPSAGVGSAFDRDAFEQLAETNESGPFNVESLTEDYEIGLRLRLLGRKVGFACKTIVSDDDHESEEYIATREYFPDGLRASIRQRSRWICGITMQTWAQLGWKGSLPVLYCLWRDRKAPLMNITLLLGYTLLLYILARSTVALIFGWDFSAADIIPWGSALGIIVTFNLAMMLWRALVKFSLVRALYGWRQGLMSAPRLIVSNIINVAATGRAAWQFSYHLWTKEPLRWLKTTHAFPSIIEPLAMTEAALGDALLANENAPFLGNVAPEAASNSLVRSTLGEPLIPQSAEDPASPDIQDQSS